MSGSALDGDLIMNESEFADFLRRVRGGDARAAEELVRLYEPTVRVAIRARLTDPLLKRHLDSVDICQSVLHSFFVRAAAGQYDLNEPAQLVGLLVRMARNKLAEQARFHHRQRRDARLVAEDAGGSPLDVVSPDPSPSQEATARDLLAALHARLTDEERLLAEHRAAGRTWVEIAAELGGTAQARRKQLGRAVNRIAPEIGLDIEEEDE
jgi:RNA polymerase sigma-70 factor (ECF subfamily)